MHLSFRRNLGNTDRIARVVIGTVLLYMAIFDAVAMGGWVSILFGIMGVAMIIEALLAY